MKSLLLKENDTIGIVAPSSPVIGTDLEKNYKRGLEEIKKMGFKYKEGKTIHSPLYCSGRTKRCHIFAHVGVMGRKNKLLFIVKACKL